MPAFNLGLDPGKKSDPAALAVVERLRTGKRDTWMVRDAQIWQIGTPHTTVARDYLALLEATEAYGIYDRTGIGETYHDLFKLEQKEGRATIRTGSLDGVLITGGNLPSLDERHNVVSVPKEYLVHKFEAKLSTGRIIVADFALADELRHQLERFGYEVNKRGNATYEALKDSDHDDLLFAVMLATFIERTRPGRPRFYAGGRAWDSKSEADAMLGSAAMNAEPAAFSYVTRS